MTRAGHRHKGPPESKNLAVTTLPTGWRARPGPKATNPLKWTSAATRHDDPTIFGPGPPWPVNFAAGVRPSSPLAGGGRIALHASNGHVNVLKRRCT